MATETSIDVQALLEEVQLKYAEVARSPGSRQHFHTSRPLAEMLGYPAEIVDALPNSCVESFAGVGNPFSLGEIRPGEAVVDVGCGAGFDSLVASGMVGPRGSVTGVDMTEEMLAKARDNASTMGASNVTFEKGLAEKLPLRDASAEVVISNGVVNLVPNMQSALEEIFRVLAPGGRLYLADIVVHKPVPKSAKENLDLWTD